ncbi:MAG: hypothetical protein HKP12_07965 [Gammaproteobacteria bacterium]|nr:hypothetical protein [Gammaproteobacteria bacterium]NNJ97082.1 hypothetical protein [Gammaproteobacteria bacterium]
MAQLSWHSRQQPIGARANDLPYPLSARAYVIASLGEPVMAAKLLNLWLQAFDNQPGISIPLHALDYSVVTQWLDTILELDPNGDYPMLAAARVYGSVNDRAKQRAMTDFIFEKFTQDPDKHWRWLANAVIIAKHELKDMQLALKYAEALADSTTSENVPYWAKDMKIVVLEDMGEIEAAKVLVGGLIASGEITDPNELNFLQNKIREIEEKSTKSRQGVDK